MEKYILIGFTINNEIVVKKTLSYLRLDEYALNVVLCDYTNDRHLEFWPLHKTTCTQEERGIDEVELTSVHKFEARPNETVDECFLRLANWVSIVF